MNELLQYLLDPWILLGFIANSIYLAISLLAAMLFFLIQPELESPIHIPESMPEEEPLSEAIIEVKTVPSIIQKQIPEPELKKPAPAKAIPKNRVAIFIDYSNFYKAVQSLPIGSPITNYNSKDHKNSLENFKNLSSRRKKDFDYSAFANDILNRRPCAGKYLYVGHLETGLQNHSNGQAQLHFKLKKSNFTIRLGEIIEYDNVPHEKGVDTLLAIDMLEGAFKNTYDIAILVSSDRDFLPVIPRVRAYGKTVEYIGLKDKETFVLMHACNKSTILDSVDIRKYMH